MSLRGDYLNYDETNDRPKLVAVLAFLNVLTGLIYAPVILTILFQSDELLSDYGMSYVNVIIGIIGMGILPIVAGIGTWQGKLWGWWASMYFYTYSILFELSKIVFHTPFEDPDPVKRIVRSVISVLIMYYFFRPAVRRFLKSTEVSLMELYKNLAVCLTIVIGVLIAGSI